MFYNLMYDSYKTVKISSKGLYKEKGSKFISYLFPVSNENQIKTHLEKVKKEHYSARHHCYAFRLGADKKIYKVNDDNEPSNTAGKPILGQIESFDLTNILIIVVRYFGGTLLGKGGLITAYRNAAKEAILNSSILEKAIHDIYSISCNYETISKVQKLVSHKDINILSSKFDLDCILKIEIRQSFTKQFLPKLERIKNLKLKYLYTT